MSRYLYGDSAPSSLDHDFLATLEVFVASATRILRLHEASVRARIQAETACRERDASLSTVQGFHRELMSVLADSARQHAEPRVKRYAEDLVGQASRLLEQVRGEVDAQNGADRGQMQAEVNRAHAEMRDALADFLVGGRLETEEWSTSMRLGAGGQCEYTGVFYMVDDVVATYRLGADDMPHWQQPRRVGELSQNVNIQVGVKKSWIRRSVQPEMMQLDEFFISRFDVEERSAELWLRKKLEGPDTLVLKVRRQEGEIAGLVTRLGEEGGDASAACDAQDSRQIEQLWQLLRMSLLERPLKRERMLAVRLGDDDIIERGLERVFIERVVAQLAPSVVEIARHSPNPDEFSLKYEDDQGRREELYLSKDKLLRQIGELAPELQRVFDPFAFTTAFSRPPPPVHSAPPPPMQSAPPPPMHTPPPPPMSGPPNPMSGPPMPMSGPPPASPPPPPPFGGTVQMGGAPNPLPPPPPSGSHRPPPSGPRPPPPPPPHGHQPVPMGPPPPPPPHHQHIADEETVDVDLDKI